MKKILGTCGCLLLLSLFAFAQGGLQSEAVLKSTAAATNCTLRVGLPAAAGIPLSPTTTVYTDSTLTVAKTQPFNTDSNGNYEWYAAPGYYKEQVSCGGATFTRAVLISPDVASANFKELNNIQLCDQFAGATAGAKIQACINALPTTGGIADARGLEGAQSIAATVLLNKKSHLLLGCASYTASVTPAFTVSADAIVEGVNRECSSITATAGGDLFSGTGIVGQFVLRNLKLIGNGAGSALEVPDLSVGVTEWDDARVTIENCFLSSFGDYALKLGQSLFFYDIRRNYFTLNTGAISSAWAADGDITDNFFFKPAGANPHILMQGGSIVNIRGNGFVYGTASGTGADIEFNAAGASDRGFVFVSQNKFGAESESASRKKIRTFNATATNRVNSVVLHDNNFFCVSGQTAFQLDNPVYNWDVHGNLFSNCSTVIADAFTLPDGATAGTSRFMANRLHNGLEAAITLFTNGGRGFTEVETPETLGAASWGDASRRAETLELRNRVSHSEALDNAAWVKTVTALCGQTDPLGTTRACKLTRAGAANESAAIGISNTGMLSEFTVKLWMKAGTYTSAVVAVRNITDAKFVGNFNTYSLTSTWQEYKFVVKGIDTGGDTYSLYIYPKTTAAASAGDMYVFGVQASDYDSDYYPTASAAASTTASGARYERAPIFGRPGATAPFVVESATAANVPNLDASRLLGGTWAIPGTIGSTTPNTGVFTTLQGTAVTGTTSVTTPRRIASGTSHVAGDYALHANWGTTATVSSVDANSKDSSFRFTVTSSGAAQGANPTVVLTFKDGTWTTVPICGIQQQGGTGARADVDVSTTATTATLTWLATPVAALTYIFAGNCEGR